MLDDNTKGSLPSVTEWRCLSVPSLSGSSTSSLPQRKLSRGETKSTVSKDFKDDTSPRPPGSSASRLMSSFCALHHDLVDLHHHHADYRRVASEPAIGSSDPSHMAMDTAQSIPGLATLRELDEDLSNGPCSQAKHSPKAFWGTRTVVQLASLLPDTTSLRRKRVLTASLIAVVVFGCAAVVPTELAIRRDPDAMRLITIINYLLVTSEAWLDRGYEQLITCRKIPLGNHIFTLVLGLIYNLAQNSAITIGCPIALVLIFKNSQLLFQMAANATLVGERYLLIHELAAFLLIIGVLIVLVGSSGSLMEAFVSLFKHTKRSKRSSDSSIDAVMIDRRRIIVPGLLLMVFANASRAISNAITQRIFAKCGNQYIEKLFYEHALGLPFLMLPSPIDLLRQAVCWIKQRERIDITFAGRDFLSIELPSLMILAFFQAYATFECTRASARVLGLSSAVTLALALALQRFLSIIFSAAIINAPPYPPASMWLGVLLVVIGAVIYVIVSLYSSHGLSFGRPASTGTETSPAP